MQSISTLNISQWKFFSEGAQHYILSYIGSNTVFQNKLLVIRKDDHTNNIKKLKIKHLHSQLKQLNIDVMSNLKSISMYKLNYKKLNVSNKEQFLQQMQNILKERQGKRNNKHDKVDKNYHIRICDNLFQPITRSNAKETTVIQFKPKSILSSKYHSKTIHKMAQKHQTQFIKINQAFQSSPHEQKTRFYKVSLKKNNNKITPLQIFSYSAKGYLQDSRVATYFKNGQSCTLKQINSEQIYDKIINLVLKDTQILNEITKLQLLHNKPLCHFQTISDDRIIQIFQKVDISSLKSQIIQSLLKINQKQINLTQIDDQQYSDELPATIAKALISQTWKDQSFIVQTNLIDSSKAQYFKSLGYYICEIDNEVAAAKITIIDYQIKHINRLQQHYHKQIESLTDYIKHKIK